MNKIDVLNELASIADKFDAMGLQKQSNSLTKIMIKIAQSTDKTGIMQAYKALKSFQKESSANQLIETILSERPELLSAARDWAKDCTWSETEEDPENLFIDEIPSRRLLALVNNHYEGGLHQLVSDFTRS
jgi:hypothetical protein